MLQKVKYYTKSEYQKIADLYSLGKILKISHLHLGYGGSAKVSVETANGKYIISRDRLSNKKDITSKSVESLQYEIDMLKTVQGLPVPCYRKSSKGSYIEKFGTGWMTVYDFISGKSPKKINPAMARELGEFLGKFHKKSHKFKKELLTRRRFYNLNPKVMKIMDPFARKQKNPILKPIVDRVKQGVGDNLPSPKFPSGPIHVDIFHASELFEGEKLSGVIDFGNFYIGPYMVDVGKTIMWNCCPNSKLDKKLLESFIKGYESKRKFSKAERVYLEKSILYAIYSHIWVDLYHVSIKYVDENWPLFLIKTFLPVAEEIERKSK